MGLAVSPWPKYQRDPFNRGCAERGTAISGYGFMWKVQLPGSTNRQCAIGSDGIVYQPSGYYLVAVDQSGSKLWQKRFDNNVHGVAVGDNGLIYVTGPTTYALDRKGDIVWQCSYGGSTHVAIDNFNRVVFNTGNTVIALDQYSGSLLKSYYISDSDDDLNSYASPIVASDGLVYVSALQYIWAAKYAFYVVDLENEKIVWVLDAKEEIIEYDEKEKGIGMFFVMDWKQEIIYAAVTGWALPVPTNPNQSWRLRAYAIDRHTGNFIWKNYVPTTNVAYYSGISLGADGNIYLTGREYTTDPTGDNVRFIPVACCLSPDGNVLWFTEFSFEASSLTPGLTLGPDGNLYFGVDRYLYVLDCNTGNVIWSYELDAVITVAPVFGDGIFYVVAGRYLYAFGGIRSVKTECTPHLIGTDLLTVNLIGIGG